MVAPANSASLSADVSPADQVPTDQPARFGYVAGYQRPVHLDDGSPQVAVSEHRFEAEKRGGSATRGAGPVVNVAAPRWQ